MIYVISDLHGDADFPGLKKYLDIAREDDLLLILGDLELDFGDTEENRAYTEYFLNLNTNIAFIDGNHENFKYLDSFPTEDWNGGQVDRLTPNIVHLRRGNIFTINGKTFFTFGGCKSSPNCRANQLWYPEEEPSDDELAFAYENLKKHDYKVDYILTHKYTQNPEPEDFVCAKLNELNDFIDKNVEFEKWYFGHWHDENIKFDDKHISIYDTVTKVE